VIHQVLPGSPRTALLAAAADAQLVVMGARGREGLDQMTLGSVAQAVLQHALCPVGVVRAGPDPARIRGAHPGHAGPGGPAGLP